jgi:hypothetical protein
VTALCSSNHGPGTSFYYQDPDGNTMEISGPNFATEAEGRAYMQSDTFQRNPCGVAIDPDDFVAKFRNGMPQAELVRIVLGRYAIVPTGGPDSA